MFLIKSRYSFCRFSSVVHTQKMFQSNSISKKFDNVRKPFQDKRLYRGLELSNGMKVLLISDPATDKSGACLSVSIGHLSDPDEIPGLAHFCEHMLFLGTEKYPNENDYSAFLSDNGGSSNAATYPDCTKFYFDVVPDKLNETLDRFSQFFLAPLFTESATEREINAVNSEHEKNLAMDVWRIRQVSKSLSDPKHAYSKFGTGNKETLTQVNASELRKKLIEFHKEWYSANLMCLAVLGKESLDELETNIVELFSKIENKNKVKQKWEEMPYLRDQLATKISVVPVKDTRSLTVSFQSKDLEQYYKSSPDHYISHLVGHEGKGSVLSYLKLKGWCSNLVGGYSTFAKGFGFFEIMVDLTEEGFKNVDEIITVIFQYINLLKEKRPQKWIYEECSNISEMHFRFKDEENPLTLVSSIVHAMQIYPLEEVLSAPFLFCDWRPELIDNLLKTFDANDVRIIVIGQKLGDICTESEKWYGTKYKVEKLSTDVINLWNNCGLNENLSLPEPNIFIPTDFSMLDIENPDQKFPVIIKDSPVLRLWWKQDTEFLKPKTIIGLEMSNPLAYSDPLNCNLAHLYVQVFKDHINEYLYAADLAGLRMSITNTTNGISVLVSGYSDKQIKFLETLLDKMFDLEIDPKRFEILKEQYIRSLKNFKAEQPYQQSIYYLALILIEGASSKEELFDAMNLATVDRLKLFMTELLSRIHVECFVYGNVNKANAFEISDLLEKKLKETKSYILPILSRQLLLKREYKLDGGDTYMFETKNEFHKSSCCSLYLQFGLQSDTSNVYLDLIAHILQEPFYNQLRTQEQLGYIVFCGPRKANGAHGLRFIVQSTKHPSYVENRIEQFLIQIEEHIKNMSKEEMEKNKGAVKSQKLEKPKRLYNQYSKFMNEISLQEYHFDRSNAEVAILDTITKDEVLEYFQNFIAVDGKLRQSLSIYIMAEDEQIEAMDPDFVEKMNACEKKKKEITDLTTFKAERELYASKKTYASIQPKGAKSKL